MSQIPSFAKAAVMHGVKGEVTVEEYPVPQEPAPGTAMLRMDLAGICATDVHIYNGMWPGFEFPGVLGHENTGTIVALGQGVTHDYTGKPLKVGDRVVANGLPCGHCYACLVENSPRFCTNRGMRYGTGSLKSTEWPHFTGGFGQYLYLANTRTAIVKVDLDAQRAVLTEPLATAISGVKRVPSLLGKTVVVQGAGAIGLLTLACAKLSGATRLILVGAPHGRLEVGRSLGADVVIDLDQVADPEARLKAVLAETRNNRGADVTFGCVGNANAVIEGLSYTRAGGTMVEIGTALGTKTVPFSPAQNLVGRSATLIGHWDTRFPDWITAVDLLTQNALPWADVVSHRVPLHRLKTALEALGSGKYELDGKVAIKVAVEPHLA